MRFYIPDGVVSSCRKVPFFRNNVHRNPAACSRWAALIALPQLELRLFRSYFFEFHSYTKRTIRLRSKVMSKRVIWKQRRSHCKPKPQETSGKLKNRPPKRIHPTPIERTQSTLIVNASYHQLSEVPCTIFVLSYYKDSRSRGSPLDWSQVASQQTIARKNKVCPIDIRHSMESARPRRRRNNLQRIVPSVFQLPSKNRRPLPCRKTPSMKRENDGTMEGG